MFIVGPGKCPQSLPLAQKLVVMLHSRYSLCQSTHAAVRRAADLLTAVPYFAGDCTAQDPQQLTPPGTPGCGAFNIFDSNSLPKVYRTSNPVTVVV